MPYSADAIGPEVQPYKYNDKEFDTMNRLNLYDYEARHYDPATIRFTTVDPLAEKYYNWSPYVYCYNNPVKYIDPTGKDGMLTGSGTKDDPYIISANYYYQNGAYTKDQIEDLEAAINDYNNLGKKDGVKTKDGSYIKFNLKAEGVDDPEKAREGTRFETSDGREAYFGNTVSLESGSSGTLELGEANFKQIKLFSNNMDGMGADRKDPTLNLSDLYKGGFVHEIGHNLGLDHSDNTSIMNTNMTPTSKEFPPHSGKYYTTYNNYPKVDTEGAKILLNRINKRIVNDLSIGTIWIKK